MRLSGRVRPIADVERRAGWKLDHVAKRAKVEEPHIPLLADGRFMRSLSCSVLVHVPVGLSASPRHWSQHLV